MTHKTLLLSQSNIEGLIGLDEICDTVMETFQAHGAGQVTMPSKITLDINPVNHQAWMNAMPAYVAPLDAAGIKWAGGFVNNPKSHNLPYVMATIILNDPTTGQNLAVMDGVYITNARTGAAGAVSAHYTARPESSVVAIIGTGVQARWTIRALKRYFPLREVRAVDVRPEAAQAYAREIEAELGIRVVTMATGDEAADGADLVFTLTTAEVPLVSNAAIGPGTTVISMGSYQEVDDAFVLSADKVLVDNMGQCMHRGELAHLVEAGRFSEADVYAELGAVAAGLTPGRTSAEERILVVPIGLGSLDIAIARKAYNQAVAAGGHQTFEFSS